MAVGIAGVGDLVWARGAGLLIVVQGPDANGNLRCRWIYQGGNAAWPPADPQQQTTVVNQSDLRAVWHPDPI